MSKGTKKPSTSRDPDEIILIGASREAFVKRVDPHSRSSGSSAEKAVQSLSGLQAEWGIINNQIQTLLQTTTASSGKTGFELEEIVFSLGITAEGSIGFIVGGKLTGEASIELTFKRKTSQ